MRVFLRAWFAGMASWVLITLVVELFLRWWNPEHIQAAEVHFQLIPTDLLLTQLLTLVWTGGWFLAVLGVAAPVRRVPLWALLGLPVAFLASGFLVEWGVRSGLFVVASSHLPFTDAARSQGDAMVQAASFFGLPLTWLWLGLAQARERWTRQLWTFALTTLVFATVMFGVVMAVFWLQDFTEPRHVAPLIMMPLVALIFGGALGLPLGFWINLLAGLRGLSAPTLRKAWEWVLAGALGAWVGWGLTPAGVELLDGLARSLFGSQPLARHHLFAWMGAGAGLFLAVSVWLIRESARARAAHSSSSSSS